MLQQMKKVIFVVMSIAFYLSFPCFPVSAQSGRGIKLVIKDNNQRPIISYSGSYALIVGVSKYKKGWPELEAVPEELDNVERALNGRGYVTRRVMDPDGNMLEKTFKDFINEYGYDENNRLLFFYSGHGATLDDNKRGYLVPIDAPDPRKDDKGFRRVALDMNQILAWCRQMTTRHVIFLFDSCFSGMIFKTKALPETPPHISAMTAQPVRQFIAAGTAKQEVPATSFFSRSFVKALRGEADLMKDGYITGAELGMYLQNKVSYYSNGTQTPQYGKINDPDLDEGDVIVAHLDFVEPSAPVSDSGQVVAKPKSDMSQKNIHGDEFVSIPAGFRAVGGDVDSASGCAKVIEHEKTGYRMRLIPAGEFYLGSPEGEGEDDEHPMRRIYLDEYWIGETEVTCEQYAQFLNEKGNQVEGGVAWCGLLGAVKIEEVGGRYRAKKGFERHPVVEVSWYGARAFCRWIGGDLPTEAQWEKAAKGGKNSRYPWGDEWDPSEANTAERLAGVRELRTYEEWRKWWEPYNERVLEGKRDWSDTTVPVGSYRANGYGLYDMSGNVWEWCLDWYKKDYYSTLREGERNPVGPSVGDMVDVEYWLGTELKKERSMCRLVRGGGWTNQASLARCANRYRNLPALRNSDYGFRVVVRLRK